MDSLMFIMMESLRDYLLEAHWDLLMVKCLDLMKDFGFTSPLYIH